MTLTAAEDPKELNADYEHVVTENGKVILRFAGNTVLRHWQGEQGAKGAKWHGTDTVMRERGLPSRSG